MNENDLHAALCNRHELTAMNALNCPYCHIEHLETRASLLQHELRKLDKWAQKHRTLIQYVSENHLIPDRWKLKENNNE